MILICIKRCKDVFHCGWDFRTCLIYWSTDSLSKNGSVIGNPKCVHDCTSQQKRLNYAGLLIEVDDTNILSRENNVDVGEVRRKQAFS